MLLENKRTILGSSLSVDLRRVVDLALVDMLVVIFHLGINNNLLLLHFVVEVTTLIGVKTPSFLFRRATKPVDRIMATRTGHQLSNDQVIFNRLICMVFVLFNLLL